MSANVIEVKQKIMQYISDRGPSLPVHLTKISEMNLTFTSAILSELLSDKKLKLSNLRVGSSPLYLIPGQEEKLEGFISNLKEPEIEAFKKLKQNKILDDEKQDPVIRVALRSIRDFAIPLKHKEKLYWKYHLLPDEKATIAISERDEPVQAIGQERVIGQQIWEDIQKQQMSKEKIEEIVRKQVEEITNRVKEDKETQKAIEGKDYIEKENEEKNEKRYLEKEKIEAPRFNDIDIKKKERAVSKRIKKSSPKDIFLKEAQRYLTEKNLEIVEVLKIDTNKLIAKVRKDKELLAIITSKKKLEEKELLRDLKKYNSPNLEVIIFLKGEPTRKIVDKIDLLGKIRKIEKIEEQ